jgi:hypothetical protein
MNKRVLVILCFCLAALTVQAQNDTVVFSAKGGFYEETFTLQLDHANAQNHIRYTTNGNRPTALSPLYTGPLLLDGSLYSTSNIYTIQVTPDGQMHYPLVMRRCIVIRAAVFDENDDCVSEVVTNSYFIRALGCNTHGLPVVSLCADSLDLFDYEQGIFVPGVYYNPSSPDWTGNYYQSGIEWERLANVEFYELDNTGINQQVGLRTHGGNGRRFQQKSVKIYAREEYGKKRFKHKFFNTIPQNNFKHLVLKPFESSWDQSGVNDYISSRIASRLNLETLASRPVVLYLNGEYWGIYFIHEKPDERFLEDHFGVDIENVNIMGNWVNLVDHGTGEGFMALCQWMETANLANPDELAYLESKIDLSCFIDYQILELFIANTDWPANNMRCWQEGNGKWRWIFYDGDAALQAPYFNVFANATYEGDATWPSSRESTLFFRKLLASQRFLNAFSSRFNELASTTFAYQNTKPYFDKIQQDLHDEVPNQVQRFGNPSSSGSWITNGMGVIDSFLTSRCEQILASLNQFLSVDEITSLEFSCYPNPTSGTLHLMIDADNFGTGKITVYDLLGRTVYTQPYVVSQGSNAITLNLDLTPGVYMLSVGNRVVKIVLQ